MAKSSRRRNFLAPLARAREDIDAQLRGVPDELLVEWVRAQGMFASNRAQAVGMIAQAFADRVEEIRSWAERDAAARASAAPLDAPVAAAVDGAVDARAMRGAEGAGEAAREDAPQDARAQMGGVPSGGIRMDAPEAAPPTAHATAPVTAPTDATVTAPSPAHATDPVTAPAGAPATGPVTATPTAPSTTHADAPVTDPVTAHADAPTDASDHSTAGREEEERLELRFYGEAEGGVVVPVALLRELPLGAFDPNDEQLVSFLDSRVCFWQDLQRTRQDRVEQKDLSLTIYLYPAAATQLHMVSRTLGLAKYQVVALALEFLVWILSNGRTVPAQAAQATIHSRSSVGRVRIRQPVSHGTRTALWMPAPVAEMAHALGGRAGRPLSEIVSLAIVALGHYVMPEPEKGGATP